MALGRRLVREEEDPILFIGIPFDPKFPFLRPPKEIRGDLRLLLAAVLMQLLEEMMSDPCDLHGANLNVGPLPVEERDDLLEPVRGRVSGNHKPHSAGVKVLQCSVPDLLWLR